MSKNKISILFMSLVIFLGFNDVSYAEGETSILIDGNVNTWTESADMMTEKTENGGVHIVCDTVENNVQYNYATVSSIFNGAYESKPVYNDEYAAICLEIENVSNANFSISFILTDKANNDIECRANVSYIKENDGDRAVETADFNSIPIEAGFKGKITIPLSEFTNSEDNTADFDYKTLTSWSLGLLIEGKQTAELYLNKLSWINEATVEEYGNSFGAYISGPDTVQIPEHGESIAFFKIEGMKGNTYSFKVDGYEKGIVFDESGKIILSTDTKEQYINLVAVDKDGFTVNKTIHLVKSWRTDNEDFPFYGPDELESVTYAFDNVEESDISTARIVIIAACVIVFVGYVFFYVRYKIEKEREEDE